jgi:hypothetical protein
MTASDRRWRASVAWTQRDGQPQSQEASIVTLDPKTVKLAVGEELPLHKECMISLIDPDGVSRLTVEATAHYLRTPQGSIHISCRWAIPLSQSILDVLTDAGLYERRREERESVALDAPAWPELSAPAGVIPVSIIDLSMGGCCVKSPLAVAVGHRLMVHVWGEQCAVAAVCMRVQWQQPVGEEFLLGCAFTQRTGRTTLASFVDKKDCATDSDSPHTGRRMQRVVFLGQAGISLVSGISMAAAAMK